MGGIGSLKARRRDLGGNAELHKKNGVSQKVLPAGLLQAAVRREKGTLGIV